MDRAIRNTIGSIGKSWKWWKKNLFSRYNKNPFLKKMEDEEEYKGEKIEE